MKRLAEVDLKNTVLGLVAGTVFDAVIDVPLDSAGLLQAWVIRDPNGIYVWGVGTGDMLTAGVGAGITVAGRYMNMKYLKEAGLGWLLALGLTKLGELVGYLRRKWEAPAVAAMPVRTDHVRYVVTA